MIANPSREIYEFSDYKSYMLAEIKSRPSKGRGMRSALAAAAGCQVAYVSHVLGGNAHFGLEQAKKISKFLGHTRDEEHFFLLLVQQDRAGTQDLKEYFADQRKTLLERRLDLKTRLQDKATLTRENQAVYYSSWHYAAIHVLLSVPGFQDRASIAKHLGLSVERTSEALEFLASVGFAVLEAGRYRIGPAQIHLEDQSPMIAKHHANWRLQAIQSMEKRPLGRNFAQEVHYSTVISLSKRDAARMKSMFVRFIEELDQVVRPSPEEEIHCVSLDFFRLGESVD